MDPETHGVIKGQRKEAPVWPMLVPGEHLGSERVNPLRPAQMKRCVFGRSSNEAEI